MPSFQFGNVVVVDDDMIGVIVKSWSNDAHEVYVRGYNSTVLYKASEIQHYVYSKTLVEDEYGFYKPT